MGTKMGVFHVDIVSAEESIYSGPAEFLVAPAEGGEVGIYPQHTPMLTRVKPGSVRIKAPLKEEELVYVSGGMLEIQPDVVTILADTAVWSAGLRRRPSIRSGVAAGEGVIVTSMVCLTTFMSLSAGLTKRRMDTETIILNYPLSRSLVYRSQIGRTPKLA
jgi:F-type H+-transporting ATPase subunit epsilon